MLLATDLDRTLFPNGEQPPGDGLDQLKAVLSAYPEIKVAFVSGRNLEQIQAGIAEYNPPAPDFVIGMVGTKVYTHADGKFGEDTGWVSTVRSQTQNWQPEVFESLLKAETALRIQEQAAQNEFKLSYYLDDRRASAELIPRVTQIIESHCPDAVIVYSVDETRQLGLLDILPKHATKLTAIDYLRTKLGLSLEEVVYAGDSGNDILPLTAGYKAILVRNAIQEVRDEVTAAAIEKGTLDQIYFAEGTERGSGYYASGIVEGLRHFGIS